MATLNVCPSLLPTHSQLGLPAPSLPQGLALVSGSTTLSGMERFLVGAQGCQGTQGRGAMDGEILMEKTQIQP